MSCSHMACAGQASISGERVDVLRASRECAIALEGESVLLTTM